jgi:hypothetical protein
VAKRVEAPNTFSSNTIAHIKGECSSDISLYNSSKAIYRAFVVVVVVGVLQRLEIKGE